MPSRRTSRGAARSKRGRWARRCGSTRSFWRPLRGARRTPRAARSPRDRHGRRATTPLAGVSHGSRAARRLHDLRVTVRVTALLPRLTGVWDDPQRRGAARPHGIGNGTHRGGARLLAWGSRSGGHFNPALTLAFYRLGRIARADALWYGIAQFAGGVAGMIVALALVRMPLAHPAVNYVATQPGPAGAAPAFLA